MPSLKAVKGGKVDDEPGVRHITLRGVAYTITEIDVPGYDKAMEAATDPETGQVPFGKLLRAMVLACVRPIPKEGWKYPVYRTLEGIVNEMHFLDLPDEAAAEPGDEAGDGEGAAQTGETAPNA